MAGRLTSSYLSTTCSVPCLPSSFSDTSRTKPSSRSTSQMRCLILLAGSSSSSSPARCALRMRVKRSATGSVMLMSRLRSPARLDHAGDLAPQGAASETDAAHLELVEEGARPAAQLAAMVGAHLELGLRLQALRLRHLGELRHSLLRTLQRVDHELLGGPGGRKLPLGGGAARR